MGSITKAVARELLPFLRVYTDGSIERFLGSPFVPPSPDQDPGTGVSSKDIAISENPLISARIFLPKLADSSQKTKLPVLVYYHGGGFCIESAFSEDHHRYLNSLVSLSNVIAVSVEYRSAPEHFLPVAYEDSWIALQWVAASSSTDNEPWLKDHGDFERVFVGGDSAGANIAHNIVMRAGKERLNGGVKISALFLTHPYFWGSDPVGSEPVVEREKTLPFRVWDFVYPNAPGGVDNPLMNPISPDAPSLAGLGCDRLFVSVAEMDELKNRGVFYCEAVKKSGWKGDVEFVEVKGEGHAFQILNYESENSKDLTKGIVSFLRKC